MEPIFKSTELLYDIQTTTTSEMVVIPISINRQLLKNKDRSGEFSLRLSEICIELLISDISEIFTKELHTLTSDLIDPANYDKRLNAKTYINVCMTSVTSGNKDDIIVYVLVRVLGKEIEERTAPIDRVVTYYLEDLIDSEITKQYPKGIPSRKVSELIGWINGSLGTTSISTMYVPDKDVVVNTSSVDVDNLTITSFKEQMKDVYKDSPYKKPPRK